MDIEAQGPRPVETSADGAEGWEFLKAYSMGFAATVVRFLERIDLVGWFNARVQWDPAQCNLSPGIRLVALILAFLVDPQALYQVAEFYQTFDCEILFGAGVTPTDFTDDALGRALIKLQAADPRARFAELSRAMIAEWGLPATAEVHADTSTITLYGKYPGADALEPPEEAESSPDPSRLPPPAVARPAYGHNKDGHPDCKQLVVGNVARPDGIPIQVDVNDGNFDDTVWSHRTLRELTGLLQAPTKVLFVADCKAIQQKTLDLLYAEDIWFVSRLPNTFKVGGAVKLKALAAADWTALGRLANEPKSSTYAIWETVETIQDHTVRLIVVKSSALVKKARAKVLARQVAQGVRWDREAKQLHRKFFHCEADAQKAWTDWQTTSAAWKWWTGTGALKSVERRHRRQGGGGLETVTEWYWEITRGGANSETLEQETLLEGLFVLIANAPEHSAKDALLAYKRQTAVEQDHHILKGPLGVAPIFLKDLDKITPYVYLVYMAVLIWQVMQAVARRNAERSGVSLPYPNGKLQPAVTTKRIKEILSKVQVVRFRHQQQVRRIVGTDDVTWVERVACLLLEVKIHTLAWLPSG